MGEEIECHCGCGRKYKSDVSVQGYTIKPIIYEIPPPIKPVLTDTFWNKEYHGELICGQVVSISGRIENEYDWINLNRTNIIDKMDYGDERYYHLESFPEISGLYPRQLAYRHTCHCFQPTYPKSYGGNWQETYNGSCHWFSMTS